MRTIAAALCIALAAVAAAPARAQPDLAAQVERLNEDGLLLFQRKQYAAAGAKFEAAYALYPDPDLLYNISRCEKALGRIDSAIAILERIGQKPDAGADLRRTAEADLRELRQARAAAQAPARRETSPAPSPLPSRSSPAPAPTPARGLGPWPWVSLAGGAAIGVVGGLLIGLGAREYDQVTSAPGYGSGDVVGMTRAEALGHVDTGNALSTSGCVLVGVGGAALVTSAVLFGIDRARARSERGAISASPALLPGGGALVVQGRF